ncbi:MAG: hypothetical protein QGH48_02160 [Candidatus Poseidoniia archaeon]|nr:hypothetical protein [Candidatus Poseidoniia archaeon]
MRRVSVFIAVAFAAIFIASINTIAEEPDYESPEIDLKFNLKEENEALSPQNKLPGEPEATKTIMGQSDDWIFFESGRETVAVGTWTSQPVEFDISISITSFDIWWESMESDNNDDCYWTIAIQHNDQEVSNDESDCTHGGGEVAKGTHSLGTSIDLLAGDTIGIDLSLTSWEDVKIYFDNVTYDSGLGITGSHLYLFNGIWKGSMVSIEFAEAWPVDWETNLDGKYVMVMGDDGYMANNDLASVRDGNEYSFQGNNSTTIEVTSTVIEWTEITGTGIKIMMDYTTFNHMPGNNTGNGTEANLPRVTLILEKPIGLLGDDGGILGLPGFEIMIAIPAIAFAARRFKN